VPLAAAVAEEVRRRMIARGMTQRSLARAAGIPPSLLHRAMQGRRQLQLDELEQLAPALGVTPLWFLRSALTHAAHEDGTPDRPAADGTTT
jgi:transcriptional regulator with XRE-family HTH domain